MKFFLLFFLISFQIFPQGYICAIGGGGEDYNDWSDAPYSWVVEKSDSGKILILSYDDASNWIPDYLKSFGASEAYNLKINSRTVADLQSTYDELITAKAILLKGGDQYKYINYWKGTKTEEAIKLVFNNGGVVGGTSAGLAVLGDLDFSAKNGSAESKQSLLNPFYSRIQLEDDFLDLIPDVLFDSHFIERGRFGRLIAMIFNANFNLGENIIGVGVDDRTAICIDKNRIGTVMGSGAAAIFYADEKTIFNNNDSGYVIENLKCDQLITGWQFDFNSRSINYIPPSAKEKIPSQIEFPKTKFWLTGSDDLTAQVNQNLNLFLSEENPANVLVFSHQGFSTKIIPLTDRLTQNQIDYNVINLSSSLMDDITLAEQISNAAAFIFAGDSLNLLSLLNDNQKLLSQKFYEKINQKTPVLFFGSSGKIAGGFFIDNIEVDIYGSYRGKMRNNSGLNLFSEAVLQTDIFEDSDLDENRTSAVLYGMMRNRKNLGIYLDNTNALKFNSDENIISGSGNLPFILVDSRATTFVDSSTYRANNSIGPRQVVAMNNLRYSISKNVNVSYSIAEGKFLNVTSIETEDIKPINDFKLNQNYPNPFNPETTLSFELSKPSFVTLVIYDMLGKEVEVLINDEVPAGNHKIKFSAGSLGDAAKNNLASGVYYYKLISGAHSESKKMIYLK